MNLSKKFIIGIIILILVALIIYKIQNVLLPFILSFIIAYFLDPLINLSIKKLKISRIVAILGTLTIFFATITILLIFILPLIYNQIKILINDIPKYFDILSAEIYPKIVESLNKFGINVQNNFSELLQTYNAEEKTVDLLKNVFNSIIQSTTALINILSLIFIVPILIFYLLKDWQIIKRSIKNNLPTSINHIISEILKEIDKVMSGYIRGQTLVCLILAIMYATMFFICKLDHGILIGLITGFLSFVPYLGVLCGIIMATIVGLFQWGFDLVATLSVTIVFVIGQIIESNFLTPNLIGSKVGLHPVWMIFGIFFFGALFGFVGVLFSVPLTATSGVIIKYFLASRKNKSDKYVAKNN